MKIIITLLLLALSPFAHATDVTLSWTAPTTNTDGSPAKIGGYNLYVATTDAMLSAIPRPANGGHPISVGNVLTTTLKNVLPGTYFYAVTTWYCATPSTCQESDQSTHVSTTISAPIGKPGIPGGVKVTVSVSAP